MSGRVLVAGVGNIFLGDDGFGVEVARRLAGETLPDGVTAADFGIRSLHLAFQLLEGYDLLILVDLLPRGGAPGSIYLLEPTPDVRPAPLDGHRLDPAAMLAKVAELGGSVGRVLVVGCEPAEVAERIGLSPPVQRAVDEAVRLVHRLVATQTP